MNTVIRHLYTHLTISFDMLMDEIDHCPDDLWNTEAGGFVFFQQVYHTVMGMLFWTRTEKTIPFEDPFKERNLYPEFERKPHGSISKEEMKNLGERLRGLLEKFFAEKDDAWLLLPNALFDKILNMDVILAQIRHIQYHAGHCDSILRERNLKVPEYRDYFGDEPSA
ncbi:hypothetical protein [Breznakiella homolactica]|uniref:DinB family protein n=1 Tax=Breznakiella homolactica TaxID=2798577 RepID=A0A7T8BB70_9SPIR|nr:hypothetical protein [Breznakiella homolactica]QQO10247.1 hypothetical protein JFL75_04830 [Breznakiella homolactica]